MRSPREHYQMTRVAKTSCIHYLKNGPTNGNRCRLTTYDECVPETCPWYMSEEMRDASYEKARQNYIRQTGKDLYHRLGYDKFLKKRKSEEVPFDVDE